MHTHILTKNLKTTIAIGDRYKSLLGRGSSLFPRNLLFMKLCLAQKLITVLKYSLLCFLSLRNGSVQFLTALIQFKNCRKITCEYNGNRIKYLLIQPVQRTILQRKLREGANNPVSKKGSNQRHIMSEARQYSVLKWPKPLA